MALRKRAPAPRTHGIALPDAGARGLFGSSAATRSSLSAGEPLSLAHKPLIELLLRRLPPQLSEYGFANLFLFRQQHAYRFCAEPIPHLRGVTYDGQAHVMPLTPIDVPVLDLLEEGTCLYPLGSDAPGLAKHFGLNCAWNAADSDYVYNATDLSRLAGAKAKRAQARSFEVEHAPVMAAIASANLDRIEAVLEGWFHDTGRDIAATDIEATREALALRSELDLKGVLVSTGRGEPVGFLLASARREGMHVVHFAKGRRAYSGVYPWMFAHYAAACGAMLLNFEQDLGNPRFAQAKRALAPAMQLHKHRLTRKLS